MLSETGAFKTDLECDPRPKITDTLFSQLGISASSRVSNRRNSDSDNEDW